VKRALVTLVAVSVALATAGLARAQDIRIVNMSTTVSDAQVQAAIPAFQQSIDQGLGPAWNTSATLYFGDAAPADSWTITIQDDTGVWGAAGYHSIFQQRPYAVVGTDTTLSWQLILSHELDEMLIDPYVDTAAGPIRCDPFGCWTPVMFLQEVCDPVEYDWYRIDGVVVSDFVTPRWFAGYRLGTDYMGLLDVKHRRFGMLHGGYKTRYRDGRWQSVGQVHAFGTRHRRR
jgi:hypothetical protein